MAKKGSKDGDTGEAETELGFWVDLKDLDETLRGRYDASRIKERNPQLVSLITFLLSVPGMKLDAIAKHAKVSWETVAAIAADAQPSIREFKSQTAKKLMLILQAASDGLLERASRGELSALDFKLLSDSCLQMAGEATVIVGTVDIERDRQREEWRRKMETMRDVTPPPLRMDLEAEEIPNGAATAGPLALGDGSAVPVPLMPGNQAQPTPTRDNTTPANPPQSLEDEQS